MGGGNRQKSDAFFYIVFSIICLWVCILVYVYPHMHIDMHVNMYALLLNLFSINKINFEKAA